MIKKYATEAEARTAFNADVPEYDRVNLLRVGKEFWVESINDPVLLDHSEKPVVI